MYCDVICTVMSHGLSYHINSGDHDNDDVMMCHSESDHELMVKETLNLGEKVEANGCINIGLICEWQLHVTIMFYYQIYCVTSQVKTNTGKV